MVRDHADIQLQLAARLARGADDPGRRRAADPRPGDRGIAACAGGKACAGVKAVVRGA